VERKLLYKLRDRRLGGAKFMRPAPIASYFVDFVRCEMKMIIEAGSQHAESAYDEMRDAFLIAQGYSILRLWNVEIQGSIDNACETILAALEGELQPFERFKTSIPSVGAAPHPALRATFSPFHGEKGNKRQDHTP
jgi:very-short-patch-repair endonuclease